MLHTEDYDVRKFYMLCILLHCYKYSALRSRIRALEHEQVKLQFNFYIHKKKILESRNKSTSVFW